MMEFNEFQTKLTEDLLSSLSKEIVDQLFDAINNIEFVRRLVSPDRKRAKDLPRDSKGRIIVDVVNPHILEDMDYFRPAALHYKKYGCYTDLRPNGNPNSAYRKYLEEERRRCYEGYVRESDGEWVTGLMYFYLNYTMISLSKPRPDNPKVSDRIEDFPEVWEGVYLRFHYIEQARSGGKYNNFEGGNNGSELAKRGASKSYTLASWSARNFILGENYISRKRINTIVTTNSKEYLIKDGTLSKFVPIIDFCKENTGFPKLRIKESLQDMFWQMGYDDVDLGITKGSLNTVIGVTSEGDAKKIRGKRGNILVDEFGSFSNLISAYNVWIPSVTDGTTTFAMMYLCGTSGDSNSDFAGAQEIMYNPEGYNMYALPNVYDKTNQGKKKFVFFFPGYMNMVGHMNKDGVSDVIGSLIDIFKNRIRVKYNSEDPNTILRTIAEIPITPAEAIIKVGVNMFPVTALTERLGQLDNESGSLDDVYVGTLEIKNEEVVFNPTEDKPIRNFPTKDNKISGAIEIFEMPIKDKSSGKIYSNRYIASSDPYDDDASNTMSLGSTFIMDLWTDRIVAEYTGRPMFADDYFETTRRMCLFYNAKLNYENNKKGLFGYFSKMNSLHLLCDTPEFLRDKQMIKEVGYGNKQKGTPATLPINNYAKTLLRAWLLNPVSKIVKEDGEDKEITVPNLYNIRNRALIQELISYNSEGNFDRISSMGMMMLFREDKLILCQGNTSRYDISNTPDPSDDDFFKNNYDRRIGKEI